MHIDICRIKPADRKAVFFAQILEKNAPPWYNIITRGGRDEYGIDNQEKDKGQCVHGAV